MMTEIDIPIAHYELPLPPTLNNSYTPVMIRGKTSFISKVEHKQFKKDAQILLNNQWQNKSRDEQVAIMRTMKEIHKKGWFLFLKVFFFLDDILSRDEDGGLKVVQDVVCKHLGVDDKYVIDAHIGKRLSKGNPRCEITVYLFNGEIE
jgi:Holliday junction resolvase RusA-like endonuclease